MINHCKRSCGECECVDRGNDECYHEIFWITDRCPLYELMQLYRQINHAHPPVEWVTSYTGCIYFKLDEEYKRKNEEIDQMLKERSKNIAVKIQEE